jgi:hypothetical protein
MAITPAFQAWDDGSIPFTRSNAICLEDGSLLGLEVIKIKSEPHAFVP